MLIPLALTLMTATPPGLQQHQKTVAERIVEFAELTDRDSYELLAVAYTESRFRQRSIGPRASVGPFQVNCKAWYKELAYDSVGDCQWEQLTNLGANVAAAVFIMDRYRAKYEQCRGDRVYSCYNGGPHWMSRSRVPGKVRRYGELVIARKRAFAARVWNDATLTSVVVPRRYVVRLWSPWQNLHQRDTSSCQSLSFRRLLLLRRNG